MQDLVVKSVVSGLGEMRKEWQKSGCNTRYNSYKLLGGTGTKKILEKRLSSGYDVLLDCHMRPHLLEVNSRPSIYTEPLDLAVNAPLVKELFSIVGFHLPSSGMNQSTLKVGS